MLCLTRHPKESIIIDGDIVVTILEVRGNKVRLGIQAPRNVTVNRLEVEDAIRRDGPRPGKEA
jgi:carbon storage regulator